MSEFQRYDAAGARGIREVVETIFRRSQGAAIESGDPFKQVAAFMERFDAYTAPARPPGFELLVLAVDGEPVGQAWGWPLGQRSGWWEGLTLDEAGAVLAEFTREDGARTFAFSEIMIAVEHTGHGLARALHDELLRGRNEERATLLVNPDNDRAYARYRRWGWQRAGTLRPNWPDAPTFDVLVLPLPLGPSGG
ncbi:GNAT family N-acetyltransferase [Nocardia asteroides]|uniref:GNAT family N-acetyltransferase n=1 Tax=Nocardia asteroides TaxID=1824 RepID=UPI001E31DC4B|nr:GNAT family N-acetyltransferase [Nocardia asteroides]UGT60236.1 GNAT family N-acetyltransferase [Nocardia asteroides]